MFFRYDNLNKVIFYNNVLIYHFFFKKYKLDYIFSIYYDNSYYPWLIFSNNFIKIYKNKKKLIYTNFINSNYNFKNSKSVHIYNVIKFKNRSSIFKNEFNFDRYIFKNLIFLKKISLKKTFYKNKNIFKLNKSYDIKIKLRNVLKKNRDYLSFFLKKKFKNINKFSKFVKNFTKKNYKEIFVNSELILRNILLRSKFFVSENDMSRFFLEGIICVNGKKCYNLNFILKKNDFVSITFNNNYYNFFKKKYHENNLLFNRITNVNLKEKNKYNSKINSKVKNLTHHKLDIPKFLEVDFLTMTFTVLYKPNIYKIYGHYLYKYLNFHTSRIYNWKSIV